MLRLGVAALFMFILVGCVKTRVAAQDFQSGTVTICGNKNAQMSDLNAKAAEQCPSAHAVRCAEEIYGTQSHSTASAYGNQNYAFGSGHTTTTDLRGNCCEYVCQATAAAPGARQ
jgi:hypothetical protein